MMLNLTCSFIGVALQICEMLRRINLQDEKAEILELVEKLKKIDPLRKGYYEYYGMILYLR